MERRKHTELSVGEHVATGLILVGLAAVMLSMVFGTSGCAQALNREHAQLKAQQAEVVAALTRTRGKLARQAREAATLQAALDRVRRQVAARDRDLELVRAHLVTANERLDGQAAQAEAAQARTREALLSQCRTLPRAKDLLAALRRSGERRVKVLARHETERFVLLVAILRHRKPDAEVRAIYQTKLMRAPATVLLAQVGARKTALAATAVAFLGRFVHVTLEREVRVDRKTELVKTLHYILRPGDAALELACVTRGDERRRARQKGTEIFSRAVRFVPVTTATEDVFQVRVMNATMSAEIARSAAAAHGSELWRYDLGKSGRCAARLVGRVGRRYALEGIH